MNDVYKAPEADLVVDDSNGDITNFKRFSAWGVFGLSIITIGIYGVYWLYTRTKVLNEFSEKKISPFLINSNIVLYCINMLSGLIPESQVELIIAGGILSLVYVVFNLVWVFTMRARLHDVASARDRHYFSIGPILTFFFQHIYLQYKINQYIDNQAEAK